MIEFIMETKWRKTNEVGTVCPETFKANYRQKKYRVRRNDGFTAPARDEQKRRAALGRYPFNIITEETINDNQQ